jgi:hypothetical protein
VGSCCDGFIVCSQRTVFFSASYFSVDWLFAGVLAVLFSSFWVSCSFIIYVILSVFGVPAFFRSADTTAAASAFSFAI